MIERNRWLNLVTHLVLCTGVVVIVFPIYLALVGATHSAQEMAQSPIPIWFGNEGFTNFKTILMGEGEGVRNQLPVSRMMWVSLVTALCIAFGKHKQTAAKQQYPKFYYISHQDKFTKKH